MNGKVFRRFKLILRKFGCRITETADSFGRKITALLCGHLQIFKNHVFPFRRFDDVFIYPKKFLAHENTVVVIPSGDFSPVPFSGCMISFVYDLFNPRKNLLLVPDLFGIQCGVDKPFTDCKNPDIIIRCSPDIIQIFRICNNPQERKIFPDIRNQRTCTRITRPQNRLPECLGTLRTESIAYQKHSLCSKNQTECTPSFASAESASRPYFFALRYSKNLVATCSNRA